MNARTSVLCLFASLALACSSGSNPSPSNGDAGGTDGGFTLSPVNGCGDTQFAASDHTAAGDARAISFPMGAAPAQYSPPCMRIKVGQTVTWTGDFASHPLEKFGGDADNPIAATSSGATASATFATAGVFGFHCANHPSSMLGAIQVVQ